MLVDELRDLSKKLNEDLIKEITEKLKLKAKSGQDIFYYYGKLDKKTIEHFKLQGLEVKFCHDFKEGDFYKFTWR